MTGLIVPRPIAWVTTLNERGGINLAPFSFFNAVGTDPGLIVLSVGNHPDRPKDTAFHIERTKEFVVNLVTREHAQAMSDSAIEYPADISEVASLNLETAPAQFIAPPRIVGSPAAFECKLERVVHIGENRIIFGLVLGAFIDEAKMIDVERGSVDTNALDLVGRMGGLGGYCYTDHPFEIERKRYDG